MEPWFAGSVLAVLMCFTCTCYFFRIPDDLRHEGLVEGRWGKPDAEFNWCEVDYALVAWIAEPVNTLSNIVYVLMPAAFLSMHSATWEVTGLAAINMSIGIGSFLFHASLRYPMQLLDEIPMLWFGTLLATGCLRRLGYSDMRLAAAVVAAIVTVAALVTSQHSILHEVVRGIMTVSFSLAIIMIAWGTTALVNRLKATLTDKRRRVAVFADRLHMAGFVMFVLSVVCWLADNYYCPVLQNLPYGLPYPHLHMWWHLLTCAALYCISVLLHIDDHQASERIEAGFCCFGLPMISL